MYYIIKHDLDKISAYSPMSLTVMFILYMSIAMRARPGRQTV